MSEKITAVQRRLLEEVADLHGVPEGAYNIRANGHLASRQTTANISIESKTDVSGIDIRIKPGTVNESVHIPVVLSESGLKEMVYNDFYIGEGSDVLIVAGCGIDNCGSQDSQHDGLHRFFVEKNAHVRYVEKHYGSGDGTGKRLLNPGTEVHLAQGSSMEMEMAWFKVPSAIKFNLTGKLPENCSGKDVILTIIGMIGVDGALYKSMEFTGEGVKNLSMDDRLCICNMAIEAGAKNGIFPVDDITLAYLQDRSEREPVVYEADPDAEYEKVIDIDLAKIVPTVACPHLPENTHPASELHDIKVDQVVIGSCTNGRMEDMEAAYSILNGKKIADGIRCIIIPGTMQIYRECVERGYVTAFIDAGAVVSTPTCGPCLGGYMGILAAGERCIATTNRNFVGRMGHVDSEVYLASPHTAAASALTGYITEYKEA